jgi:hypothetical protein
MSATAAFATVILERVLDMLTVLVLLAAYVFFFRPELATTNAVAFEAVKWAGGTAAVGAIATLIVFFVLAGDPGPVGQNAVPSRKGIAVDTGRPAGSRVAEKFATGLGRGAPAGRLLVALILSLPLWLLNRDGHLGRLDGFSSGDPVYGILSRGGTARGRRRGADARALSAAFTRRTSSRDDLFRRAG